MPDLMDTYLPELAEMRDDMNRMLRETQAVLTQLMNEFGMLDQLARQHQPSLHPFIVAHMEGLLGRLELARQTASAGGTRQ